MNIWQIRFFIRGLKLKFLRNVSDIMDFMILKLTCRSQRLNHYIRCIDHSVSPLKNFKNRKASDLKQILTKSVEFSKKSKSMEDVQNKFDVLNRQYFNVRNNINKTVNNNNTKGDK